MGRSSYKAQANDGGLPRLGVNPSAHKLRIGLHLAVLFVSGCVVPVVCYFAIHYTTTLELKYILAVCVAVFGVSALYSLILRTWLLTRAQATFRPLGSNNLWNLDYFQWNFIIGFVYITIISAIGTSTKPQPDLRIVAMPLPILIGHVCTELLTLELLRAMGVRAPFRLSSTAAGEEIPPGVSLLAEDIVAVDAKQGRSFRSAWKQRSEGSKSFRRLLVQLDLMWGLGGLMVSACCLAVIWGVENADVGYAVGKLVLRSAQSP